MKHTYSFLLLFSFFFLLVANSTIAQTAVTTADGAFLQGQFVEVGITNCGSFGAADQPAGFNGNHNIGGASTFDLGFVADPDEDGWSVNTAGGVSTNYCGDYFIPGSPAEGFIVQVGSDLYENENSPGVCGAEDITGGTFSDVSATPGGEATATWSATISGGAGNGLEIQARTHLHDTALWFVTNVLMTNTTSSPMTNVYYLREFDPDNDQKWPGGSFTTINQVETQGTDTTCEALVSATAAMSGCYVGLGSRNNTARVAICQSGLTFSADPDEIWEDGNGGFDHFNVIGSGSLTSDVGIGIVFKYDVIPPGATVSFAYAHILSNAYLEDALNATLDNHLVIADGMFNITDTLHYNLCDSGSVELDIIDITGVNLYEWSWSPATGLDTTAGTSVTATLTSSTSYSVLGSPVSAASGCSNIEFDVTISVIPGDLVPMAQAVPRDTVICPGDTLMLQADSTIAVDWIWAPGAYLSDSLVHNPLLTLNSASTVPAEYLVGLTSNIGCHRIDTVTVDFFDIDPDAGIDDTICSGETVGIGSAGVSGYLYNWMPSTGLDDPFSADPNLTLNNMLDVFAQQDYEYIVEVTSMSSGCVLTDTVIITVEPDHGGIDIGVCPDLPGQLGELPQPGYTYSWTPSIGLSDPNIANPIVTLYNGSTTPIDVEYVLDATSTTGLSCDWNDTITVTVNIFPIADAGPDSVICEFVPTGIGSAPLPNHTYSWTPIDGLSDSNAANPLLSADNTDFSFQQPHDYIVLVVDTSTGCINRDTVTMYVNFLPGPAIGGPLHICQNYNTELFVNEVFPDYLWSEGTTDSIAIVPAGTYTVTVTDTNGCENTSLPVTVVESLITPNAAIGTNPPSGTAMSRTEIAFTDQSWIGGSTGAFIQSWFWDLGDGSTTDLQDTPHTYNLGGDYNVMLVVTSSDGCSDTARIVYNVLRPPIIIPNVFTPNGDGINDKFKIENGYEYSNTKVVIYNRWGNLVYENNNYKDTWGGEAKGDRKLENGVYYYIVELYDGTVFKGTVSILGG